MKLSLKYIVTVMICAVSLVSCQEFLEIDDPFGEIPENAVYEHETTANAAIITLYGKLREEVFVTGSLYGYGLGVYMGLYADEFINHSSPGLGLDFFDKHQIVSSNETVAGLWNGAYQLVYMCNAALNGVESSNSLSSAAKQQLRGEALFVRSLVYFYLVNLFGDVPYIYITDYENNTKVSRMPFLDVYDHIIIDLKEAKSLLGNTYAAEDRSRANALTASALLARCYLYLEQWDNAVSESSVLIENESTFKLEPLNQAFLAGSEEAILQLKPGIEGTPAREAATYILTGRPASISLSERILGLMEENDGRRENWIGEFSNTEMTWYFPYKYKTRSQTTVSAEYSVVFRLAEQYLIRAEGKARLGDLTGGLHDLNAIRQRAGVPLLEVTTNDELMDAIIQERYIELFSEHGHRWFDLKRWGMAEKELKPLKPAWRPTNALLPVPQNELLMNPNLMPQNPGYQ